MLFAPDAKLRAQVTACTGQPVAETAPVTVPAADPVRAAPTRRRASIHWARLIARIYETRPLTCPRCQGEMRPIAFLTEPASIRALLAHLGEPTTPPALAPRARDPPLLNAGFACAFDQSPSRDSTAAASEPSFRFDQTLH